MTETGLRIVFMGTPDFAVASLSRLLEKGYRVVAVITAPDKPAGRGKKMTETAVKQFALKHGVPVLQPEKLRDPEFLAELQALAPDLQVVVAFRMLPEAVWRLPRLGTFNLHGSLLPQYRGAAPLNWAIINGEKETGVTTFLLDHEIDTGKILFREKIDIDDNDTVGEIHDRLMEIGADLVVKTADALAQGTVKPIPQSEVSRTEEIKPAPKIFKEDCKIDWSKNSETIRNLIRGLSPYPSAWANLVHKETGRTLSCKIFFAQPVITNETAPPGTIDSDNENYLNIACGTGWLEITDLQLSGKKRLPTADFLHGFRQISEYRFE